MGIRRLGAALVPVLILTGSLGCSKEKMAEVFQKGADQVEESVAQTTELVKKQAGLAGKFELVLDGPVSTQACYASLVSFASGRPSVLQLSACDEAARDRFDPFLEYDERRDDRERHCKGGERRVTEFLERGPELDDGAAHAVQFDGR